MFEPSKEKGGHTCGPPFRRSKNTVPFEVNALLSIYGRLSCEHATSAVLPAQPGEGREIDQGISRESCSRGYSPTTTALVWVYCSSTSCPISRPQPDCLYPPKGNAASNTL
jgi:hypothetical protein